MSETIFEAQDFAISSVGTSMGSYSLRTDVENATNNDAMYVEGDHIVLSKTLPGLPAGTYPVKIKGSRASNKVTVYLTFEVKILSSIKRIADFAFVGSLFEEQTNYFTVAEELKGKDITYIFHTGGSGNGRGGFIDTITLPAPTITYIFPRLRKLLDKIKMWKVGAE